MAKTRFAESLQRYIWFHNHAQELGDSYQNVVRRTSAISDWVELGRRYPKAKQALNEIRDAKTREFAEGGYADLFHDVASINGYLQQDDATVKLFKEIAQRDAALAQQCYLYVEEALLERSEYELCLKMIGDPQQKFEVCRHSWQMQKQNYQRIQQRSIPSGATAPPVPAQPVDNQRIVPTRTLRAPAPDTTQPANTNQPTPGLRLPQPALLPDMAQLADNNFIKQLRKLIQILVGVGRKAEAENIRDQAVALLNVLELQSAVSDAEEKIRYKLVQNRGAKQPVSPVPQSGEDVPLPPAYPRDGSIPLPPGYEQGQEVPLPPAYRQGQNGATRPLPTVRQNFSFGPVMERVLSTRPRSAAFLNLSTGQFVSPPENLDPADWGNDGLRNWAAENQVDVFATINAAYPRTAWCYTHFKSVLNEVWDHPDQLDSETARLLGQPPTDPRPVSVLSPGEYPVTLAFKNVRGTAGLLQILGYTDDLRGVKIRYKLVQNDKANAPSVPPVVVKTIPESGTANVDPGLTELRVTFSKLMRDGCWAWCKLDEKSFPELTGQPRYLEDGRTCVLPVKLRPGKVYATWINVDELQDFRDRAGQPAVPYLLIFKTKE